MLLLWAAATTLVFDPITDENWPTAVGLWFSKGGVESLGGGDFNRGRGLFGWCRGCFRADCFSRAFRCLSSYL